MARKRWRKKAEGKMEPQPVEEDERKGSRYLLIGVLLLLLIAGYFVFAQGSTPEGGGGSSKSIRGRFVLLSDKASTHEAGKVVLLEFFDFYCPHCYRFHVERWPALKERYGDRVVLVDKGYPLRQRSILPIEAYEIARDMGRGEEMKDAMFKAIHEDGRSISTVEALGEIAASVGLDRESFSKALSSHAMAQRVNENIRLGNSYNLDQTPTIIIDGNIKVVDTSVENLETIIDSLLEGE